MSGELAIVLYPGHVNRWLYTHEGYGKIWSLIPPMDSGSDCSLFGRLFYDLADEYMNAAVVYVK